MYIDIEIKCNEALDLFINGDYFRAYELLFEQMKANPNNDIINVYLSVFATATGNRDIANYYINELGYDKFKNYITEQGHKKLIDILLGNVIQNREWDNYRRPRNQNEINRMAVTAPLCKGNVLEIGCASGALSSAIAMHAENLFGIDIDPVAIELARYKVKELGLNNCFFNLGDGSSLSFPDNSFDTVVLAEVLEHVEDPNPFIEEAIRVCKSAGRLIISVPKGYSIPDPDHARIFTKKDLLTTIHNHTDCKLEWVEEVPGHWLLCYIDLEKEDGNYVSNNLVSFFLPPHKLNKLDESEKVSIIIPTFNRAEYLKESLDSVLKQTYPNKEIIVVNDGSTDNTEEVLEDFRDKIVYIYKENGGKSSAINLGLKKATGKYVWIFDDDDIALPKKLEVQIRKFQENSEIGLIHTSAIYFQENEGNKIFNGMFYPRNIELKSALKTQLQGNHFFTPSVIVKKECYDYVGKWDENLIRAQDYDMWTRISRFYKTYSLNLPTVQYRIHSGRRGSEKEKIDINNLQNVTMKYHLLVVKKIHSLPIHEVFPTQIVNRNNLVTTIEAYLERAIYMFKYQLIEEAIEDIENAKKLAVNSGIKYLNFSANGLKLINQLSNDIDNIKNPKAVLNVLYFVKMIKKANEN